MSTIEQNEGTEVTEQGNANVLLSNSLELSAVKAERDRAVQQAEVQRGVLLRTELKLAEVNAERDAARHERDTAVAYSLEANASREQVTAEQDALRASNTQLSEQITNLNTQNSNTYGQLRQAQTELTEFKKKVVRVAMELAQQYDWCEVVTTALEEMGLEVPRRKYSGRITITVDFDAELAQGRTELPESGWVESSMSGLTAVRRALRDLSFDSDHQDHDINDVQVEIEDIEWNNS